MPQLHFYLPRSQADEIRERAAAQGETVSAFLAQIVRRELRTSWPEGYFERVVGCWKGEPLERPQQGVVEARDELA